MSSVRVRLALHLRLSESEIGANGNTVCIWIGDRPSEENEELYLKEADGIIEYWRNRKSDSIPLLEMPISIIDSHKILQDALWDGKWANAEASLFLYVKPIYAEEETALLLARGIVKKSPVWEEEGRLLIISLAINAWADVNKPLTRCIPKGFSKESAGKPLPLLYGRYGRAETILIQRGGVTELANGFDRDGMECFLSDGFEFPQEKEITLRIGREEMRGMLEGNRFSISERGLSIATGTLAEDTADSVRLRLSEAFPVVSAQEMEGREIVVSVDENSETKDYTGIVASYNEETGVITLINPLRNAVGSVVLPPEGSIIVIQSPQEPHNAGESVVETGIPWIYAISEGPIASIETVYGRAAAQETIREAGILLQSAYSDWVILSDHLYEARVNDERFPAIAPSLATIEFPIAPLCLGMHHNRILADVQGINTNPLDSAKDMLIRSGFLESDIEANSFQNAWQARDEEQMAFCIDTLDAGADWISGLLFQSRIKLRWTDDKKIVFTPIESIDIAPPSTILAPDDILFNSTTISLTPEEDQIDVIRACYRDRKGEKQYLIVNEETNGIPEMKGAGDRKVTTLDIWGYADRKTVARIAHFLWRRKQAQWRQMSVVSFLKGLPLEAGEKITLSHPLLNGLALDNESVTGIVSAVEKRPPILSKNQVGSAAITLRLQTKPGCQSTCETSCEISSCETTCETIYETEEEFACHSSCETHCQISCVTACELTCETYCQTSRTTNSSCNSSVEGSCLSQCQTACESSCQICCETSCESFHKEKPRIVKKVDVQNAPLTAYGIGMASEYGRDCPAFAVFDDFDLRPKTGEKAATFLNAQDKWTFLEAGRDVKLVKIIADLGDRVYTVQETDADGVAWGSPFTGKSIPEG